MLQLKAAFTLPFTQTQRFFVFNRTRCPQTQNCLQKRLQPDIMHAMNRFITNDPFETLSRAEEREEWQ